MLVVKVFRTTPDGRTFLHEFADEKGIYFITTKIPPKISSKLVSISEFLAAAGALTDTSEFRTSKSSAKRKVFISYAREDEEFVDKLCQQLEERSICTWIDRKEIKPGDIWDDKIDEALRECDAMILVQSPDSVQSPNVAKEWKFFMRLNRPLIPILWRDCMPHFQLVNLQHIDFRNYREGAIGELVLALKKYWGL